VVIRSHWQRHAPAGEQRVTQLAAHSIAVGKRSSALHEDFCEEGASAVAQSLPQSWQAGDVIGSIRATAGLPIPMTEFDNRRTVTLSKTVRINMSIVQGSGIEPPLCVIMESDLHPKSSNIIGIPGNLLLKAALKILKT